LATTSKRKAIDPAMLRPGRLDLHVEVPLPSAADRLLYLKTFLSQNHGFRLSHAQVEQLAAETEAFTYADLESMLREAALTALRLDINCEFVEFRHFN
jgi:SpoVK/Ycf46/Vps4 family AAA+-type ATPase